MGFWRIVLTIILPPLAAIAGLPAFLVLGYMTRTTMFLGNLPWAQSEVTLSPLLIAGYYGMLVTGCGYLWRTTRYRFVGQPPKDG